MARILSLNLASGMQALPHGGKAGPRRKPRYFAEAAILIEAQAGASLQSHSLTRAARCRVQEPPVGTATHLMGLTRREATCSAAEKTKK